MSEIFLKSTRIVQPQSKVIIDRGNPFGEYIRNAYIGGSLVDIAGRTNLTKVGSPVIKLGVGGKSWSGFSTANYLTLPLPTDSSADGMTVVLVGKSFGDSGGAFDTGSYASDGNYFTYGGVVYTDALTNVRGNFTPPAGITLKPFVMAVSLSAISETNNYAIYINGSLMYENSTRPLSPAATAMLGRDSGAGGAWNGEIYGFFVLDKFYKYSPANGASLLKQLTLNPWQIFAPQKRTIYFSAATGGGGGSPVSGTFASTESTTDTTSASGKIIVKGALSVTESDNDTISLSGKVITKAALSVTESIADTFSALAKVKITGSFALNEITGDSLSFDGDVILRGSLSVTESTVDTASFNGSGGHFGTMGVTESTVDTFAAGGDVIVKGGLSASEISDSFTSSGKVYIKGNLSVTELITDSFSASAGAIRQGTMSANETVDSMSMSGFTSAVGLMNANETTDTLSGTAKSIITGSFLGQDISDTSSMSGKIYIKGILNAQEYSDTFFTTYGDILDSELSLALAMGPGQQHSTNRREQLTT